MFASLMVLALATSACSESEKHASGTEASPVAKLPSIRMEGKDYPYIRYPEVTGKTESRGRAFFLYPMTDRKDRWSALEYTPGMKMESLFAEDMIGITGLVIRIDRQIRMEFLPISIPIGVTGGQEWRMQHAKREFACKSEALVRKGDTRDQIEVSCTSGMYTLNFKFSRELGVVEYQDFCNHSICTYELADSHGLLSRKMTHFMGLPRI